MNKEEYSKKQQKELKYIKKMKRGYYLKNLKDFKKAGIKKVELICGIKANCECCKDLLGKQILLEDIVPLPMKKCELPICYGRYNAVVDFDLTDHRKEKKMFCKNCGKEIADDAVMCPSCGQPYKKASEGKSWIAALLLCLFLGGFGAHRFYVGKTGSAVAQLLLNIFGWATAIIIIGLFLLIPLSIWVFVDFILIIAGKFKAADGSELER